MDQIDRDILRLLQRDASLPLKTIAAQAGLSRTTLRQRIARLQAAGVIRRFTIETADDGAGIGAVLQVRLKKTPDPAMVKAVVDLPAVVRCYSLSGDIDLLVELAERDVPALNQVRDHIAALPGVAAVTTALILKRDKQPV